MIKPTIEKIRAKFTKSDATPLPYISSPYNQSLKSQQEALIITLIIAIAIAAFYTYFYTQSKIAAESQIEVLVLAKDLEAPHKIEASDLSTAFIAQKFLPDGSFSAEKKEDLIGSSLTQSVKAKQLVLAHYLQSDLNPDSVSAKFDQWFALSMDEDWFVAKLPNLKANDKVDLVVTNPRDRLSATSIVASSLKVIAVSKAGNKRSLVVNATEEEAKAIIFAKGLKLPMQILVHSAIETPPQEETSN